MITELSQPGVIRKSENSNFLVKLIGVMADTHSRTSCINSLEIKWVNRPANKVNQRVWKCLRKWNKQMKVKINNYTIDNKKCKTSKWVQRKTYEVGKTLNGLSKCNLGQATQDYSLTSHQ